VPDFLHVFLQCLILDLILSTKTVSATVGGEEGFIAARDGKPVPKRILATDSCSLDKYDMPVARNEMVHKPLEIRNKTIDSQFT
jgi:hypothetical protein